MSRALTFLAAAALLLVGLAAPTSAQADEPASAAAVPQVVWDPQPTVARIGPGLNLTLTFATHLHDQAGLPMAGERVRFTLFQKAAGLYDLPRRGLLLEVCDAETDANGLATCKGNVKALLGSVLSLLAGGGYATLLIGPFPSDDEFTKLPVILSN